MVEMTPAILVGHELLGHGIRPVLVERNELRRQYLEEKAARQYENKFLRLPFDVAPRKLPKDPDK